MPTIGSNTTQKEHKKYGLKKEVHPKQNSLKEKIILDRRKKYLLKIVFAENNTACQKIQDITQDLDISA